MTTISLPPRRPGPFQAVRASRDVSLVAFVGALLVAFALQAGAFLPRLEPAAPVEKPRIEQAPEPHAPAVVARHGPVVRRAVAAEPAPPAKAHAPCTVPRG